MAKQKRTTWLGGYIHYGPDGKPWYVIRKRFAGKRWKVATGCHTEAAALSELARFEKEPARYAPGGGVITAAPVYLDSTLVDPFLKWSRTVQGNSRKYVGDQQRYLAWWADELKGVDLRTATLAHHLLPALDRAKGGRQPRVAVIKVFYGWLRHVRELVALLEDPTFGRLKVPQSQPEQWRRVKAITRAEFVRLRSAIPRGQWRDAVDVLGGTGWHVTELDRFAHGGTVDRIRGRRSPGGILICPQTKGGEPLRTEVSKPVLDAAKRLRKRGTFSKEWFARAVKEACVKAKVKGFGAGSFRHSVATWAVNKGTDIAAVAAFLGHKSTRTTKRFYATHATPAKIPTLT